MNIFCSFLMVLILTVSTTVSSLAQNQSRIAEILPGVVKITTNMRPTNFVQEYTNRTRGVQWGTGSGFIISREGHIVTNHHVVKDAYEIWITFYNRQMVRAKTVASDAVFDLAVLQPVESVAIPKVLEWGRSSQVRAGDHIFAIGNPLGLEFSVSEGIVSHPSREMVSPFYTVIQTDASINQGNSGGPILNFNGQVIGVAVSIASQSGGSIGLGFAIPSDIAKTVVDTLITGKPYQRRVIGVEVEQNWQITHNTINSAGVRIKSVTAGSFAERAGIRQNDLIVEINDVPVNSVSELIIKLSGLTGELRIGIIRNGQRQVLVVNI